MNILCTSACLTATIATIIAAEETMKVESKSGSVTSNLAAGETVWMGDLTITHPRFVLKGTGRATLYAGIAIKLPTQKPGEPPPSFSTATTKSQWISLVAIGEWEIITITDGSRSEPVRSDRFIYLPKKDQIVIGWPDQPGKNSP